MFGLINTAIEGFVLETYGEDVWARVMDQAGLGYASFEAMLPYSAAETDAVLEALALVLGRPREHMLEDVGTFLVTSPNLPAFRRLLRFGGMDYADFVHSLEDLPGRVRLAVDDLILPAITVRVGGAGLYHLTCAPGLCGYGHVMLGVLRAMADDYGTLALLEHREHPDGREEIDVKIVEDAFAEGNAFELGARWA